MRSWQVERYGEPREALALCEVEEPEPAAGEVRIAVAAAAIGLPDVFMCRSSYVFKPELPFTPGQEVSGIVTAVGAGSATPVGSRVMAVTAFFRGFGGFAESALALDASTYPAPDDMDAGAAACFVIPYHTAYLGLVTRGRIEAGETLVVLGAAGGSGSGAVALGRALGANVIAVAGGSEKVEACRALGADTVIDHRERDIGEAVREATDGRGADLIYDPVGGAACASALRAIASEGRLLAIGYASGEWHDASTQALVGRNASVVGVFVGAYSKPFLSDVHEVLLKLWRAGGLPSLVSRDVEFSEVPAALDDLACRRTHGKAVVRLDRS